MPMLLEGDVQSTRLGAMASVHKPMPIQSKYSIDKTSQGLQSKCNYSWFLKRWQQMVCTLLHKRKTNLWKSVCLNVMELFLCVSFSWICFFPSPSFSSLGPVSHSLSFGGRYYVIVGGIEHKSRGSSGPMNYWWESRRDPPRSVHFTSSSPHSRVNQAKCGGGGGGGEGETERRWSPLFGWRCRLPLTASELWTKRKWWCLK